MTLPTIHEVTSMFLYGSATPPNNFTENDLTEDRGVKAINVDTDEFLDSDDGPGRFVVASNSVMMQRFFQTAAADYAAGTFSEHRDDATGIVTMTKAQLDEVYGLTANKIWHGIAVDNKWVYDDLDDYAARTYIYGNISFKISEDANFVIYPDGRLEVQNFSLEVLNGNDFDWTTRVDDILTMMGNTVLKRAIDPSGIGQTVLLKFDAATSYTYTQADFSSDVARADSVSTILSPLSISQAMGGVIQELYEEGTIQSVMDGKLVLYGSDNADVISLYTSRTGVNVSDPGYDLPNPLSEHTDDGLIYVAGAGNDTITGTSDEDVLFGGQGADKLFGGSGDDFIFFDAEDTVVNGGAGRDVGWAIGPDAIDADMAAWAMEVQSGGSGADTVTMSGADSLMAAGGDGDDVFNLNANNNEGLRIVWGGAGADVINFAVDYTVEWFDRQVGILVVNVVGLTVDTFATLTPDILGLDGINLSKIHCIILNPDATDQVQFDGMTMNSEDYEFFNDDIGSGPNGSGTNGYFFGTRASPFLGDERVIQGVFVEEGWAEHLFSQDLEYYQVIVTPTSTTVIPSDEFSGMRWSSQQMVWVPFEENDPEVQANVTRIQGEAAEYFAVVGTEPFLVQEAGDRPEWPWFVAGGSFSGNSLVTDNSISATLPDPPNTLISDWLLVA